MTVKVAVRPMRFLHSHHISVYYPHQTTDATSKFWLVLRVTTYSVWFQGSFAV